MRADVIVLPQPRVDDDLCLTGDYEDMPVRARPQLDELADFARLFATYLEKSFDLIEDPGKKLYSPDSHCFCPLCSWVVDASNLMTNNVRPADKSRAQRMKFGVVKRLAHDAGIAPSDDALGRAVVDARLRESLSMVIRADDLLHRLNGDVQLARFRLDRSASATQELPADGVGEPVKRKDLVAALAPSATD